MRTSLIGIGLIALTGCGAVQPAPVSWTPELVSATQQNFSLAGEWSFTARRGADFGARCDILFNPDNTYRKSCRPPVEEAGDWAQVGEWDGHTMRIRLSDRVNLIEKRPLPDVKVEIVVETPERDVISMDGERYDRVVR